MISIYLVKIQLRIYRAVGEVDMSDNTDAGMVTEAAMYKNKFYWTIRGLKCMPHQPGDKIKSKIFYTYKNGDTNGEQCDGVEWYLEFYPRGYSTTIQRYVWSSVFLRLAKYPGENIEVNLTVSTSKVRDGKRTNCKAGRYQFAANSSWGPNEFINHATDELYDCEEFVIACELSHRGLKGDTKTIDP